MTPTRTDAHRQPDMRWAVAEASTVALHQLRLAGPPIAEVRAGFAAATASLDAAVDAAAAGGAANRPLLEKLRTAREVLLLDGLYTKGIEVPECAQTSSLDAEGPQLAGMVFERIDPDGPAATRTHGLDLTAALEPITRATAGCPGAHLPSPRRPGRRTPSSVN